MKATAAQLPRLAGASASEAAVDEVLQALTTDAELHSSADDQSRHGHVPTEVLQFIGSITRSQRVARYVLLKIDDWVCRRLPSGNSIEVRRKRWTSAWQYKAEQLKRRMGRIRDREVRYAHLSLADDVSFKVFARLPKVFQRWRPNDDGKLVVDDASVVTPSIGSSAFLEQTPVQVIRFAHEVWKRRAWNTQDEVVCLSDFRLPRVWDLTAGSGTVRDYLQRILGCRVISRDFSPVAAEVECASATELGTGASHTGRRVLGVVDPGPYVRRPDLIFFDPPSLGTPVHRELYHGPEGIDLAELPPEAWVETVARIAIGAVQHLGHDGMVSLLLRHGSRRHGEVQPLPKLLEDVKKEVVDGGVEIVAEHLLRFRTRRNQVSLGQARVPATHLLLGRPS